MVELTYKVTVKDIPEETDKIAIWIPTPWSNSVQRLKNIQLLNNLPYNILADKEYGNRFIYVELSKDKIQNSEISLTAIFDVSRKTYRMRKAKEKKNVLRRFLLPDSLIPLNGKIAQEAHLITKGVDDPYQKAKLLFDHIVTTVKYDKSGVGWGKGDALYACDVRKGNCTDFHSLFIGEARALGIPARFIMGFPLPPKDKAGIISGYHCWAEFYSKEWWIPLDASEASKNLKRKVDYFGFLNTNRISFTIGRDIQLPFAQSNPVKNYIIYPYAEVDGREIPVNWQMSFKNL